MVLFRVVSLLVLLVWCCVRCSFRLCSRLVVVLMGWLSLWVSMLFILLMVSECDVNSRFLWLLSWCCRWCRCLCLFISCSSIWCVFSVMCWVMYLLLFL